MEKEAALSIIIGLTEPLSALRRFTQATPMPLIYRMEQRSRLTSMCFVFCRSSILVFESLTAKPTRLTRSEPQWNFSLTPSAFERILYPRIFLRQIKKNQKPQFPKCAGAETKL